MDILDDTPGLVLAPQYLAKHLVITSAFRDNKTLYEGGREIKLGIATSAFLMGLGEIIPDLRLYHKDTGVSAVAYNYISEVGYLKLVLKQRNDHVMLESDYLLNDSLIYKAVDTYIRALGTKGEGVDVYTVGTDTDGLALQKIGTVSTDLVRDNYSEDVIAGYDYVAEQFNSKDPKGRIVILNGPAGSGKTTFVKALIPKLTKSIVILVPAKLIGEIDGPNLSSMLSNYRYMLKDDLNQSKSLLFIMEDADECLASRDSGNIGQISSILNIADGIFGSMLDMRILATTNIDTINFDDALVRPGRLCKHIHIGLLDADQANKVYERESGSVGTYKKPVTLAQVYADAHGANTDGVTNKKVERKVGFGA
jgi:energy-coupling factor transporter ATP-binding protein EcfA2